jgi:hypothetical protein
MATINQKRAFDRIMKKVGKGGKVSVSKEMRGIYSPSVAKNPKKLTSSRGFQELLAKISDKEILDRFYEILRDKDKRASLEAGKELLKLKDRYPDKKIKLDVLDQRKQVFE